MSPAPPEARRGKPRRVRKDKPGDLVDPGIGIIGLSLYAEVAAHGKRKRLAAADIALIAKLHDRAFF